MRCHKCGKSLPPDSKFCQYCGEDLSKVNFCSSCGFQLQEGMKFCPQCGKDIHAIVAIPEEIRQEKKPHIEVPVVPSEAEDTSSKRESAIVPTAEVNNPCFNKAPIILSFPGKNNLDGPAPKEERSIMGAEDFTEKKNLDESATGDAAINKTKESLQTDDSPDPQELPTATDTDHAILQPEDAEIAEPTQNSHSKKKKGNLAAIAVVILAAIIAVACILPKDTNPAAKESPTTSEVDMAEITDSVLYLEIYDENGDVLGTASGFLVNNQTTLVTNYHVIQDAYSLMAWSADETESVGINYYLAYDEVADLAILECESGLTVDPIPLGNSDLVMQSDPVYAIGYPLGLANTISNGIVSSRYEDEFGNDILQVTAAISEGNSGGPLLDAGGHVIGVMCAYYVYGQNMNIAIASNTLERLLDSDFEKTSLKYWRNRPAMPGLDSTDELQEQEGELQEQEDYEASPEETPPAEEKAPQKENKDQPTVPPPAEKPEQPTPPEPAPAPKSSTYSYFPSVPDFGYRFSVKESFFEEETQSYHYYWSDIGDVKNTCDATYFDLLKSYGFTYVSNNETLYGTVYFYSNGSTNVEYSNYNGRVCISIS